MSADPRSALATAGHKWRAAREREREAMGAVYAAICRACEDGMTEVEAARVAGVDRMTVRKARGKL